MPSPSIHDAETGAGCMPLLLLIPLLLAGAVLLYLLLLPLALLQRYRLGRARRRALAWMVGANAWLLLLSAASFLLGAWMSEHWIAGALRHATVGLLAGLLLGVLGLAATRFDRDARGWFYTPNRWVVLAVTVIVAARIGYGCWSAWSWTRGAAGHAGWLAQQGSLLLAGGLLLGYYLAYYWGLRARIRRG